MAPTPSQNPPRTTTSAPANAPASAPPGGAAAGESRSALFTSAGGDPAAGQSRSPLSEAARDVAVEAAQGAAVAEAERRLSPDVVKAAVAAGFARHLVPTAYGGDEGSFLELGRAVSAVGEGCAATAWCVSLAAHVGRMAAHLPEEGRREVWADGPDAFFVAALTPIGTAHPEPGGYRLTGTWPFVSAIDHADWALLTAQVPGAAGGPPEPRVLAVPRDAWRTEDTWHNVGMAATGSHTVIVKNLFVPAGRTVSRDDLFTGRGAADIAPRLAVPMQATTMMFAVPALGAAKGALTAWRRHAERKIRAAAAHPAPALPGMPTFNRVSWDVTLTRSATEIDAAELLLERAARTVDEHGPHLTALQTMRGWRDCAMATDALVAVANRLFRGVGTTGQSSTNPVQRFWRDINSMSGHQALQVESAATAYAYRALGL
ncbi:acyl-CoA dehydrogenase family protein [Streptomyces sp. NPDC048581]|uniref:acyl-CoA dehydrogenase family protein n=1 Tax=unclassified Streptomyces TaxID=2593676 RepID=UPI00371363A8